MGRNTETRAAVVTNVVEQNRNERNRRKKKTKTKTRKKGLSTPRDHVFSHQGCYVFSHQGCCITKVMPLNLAPMISCDPRTDMLHNFKGQVEELSLVNILILVKKSVSSSNYEVQLWRHIKLNVAVQLCVQHTSVAPRMIRYTGNHWDATFVAQNAWHQVCDRFSAVDMLPELPPPYTTSTVVIK